MMRPFIPVLESWGLLAAYGKREEHAMRYGRLAPISHSMLFSFTDAYARTFGNLLIVRMQLVQMFTGRFTPSISTRRCCTLRTKRRRVRRCEWLTLLPCIGLRPQISQRPDIHHSSFLFVRKVTFGPVSENPPATYCESAGHVVFSSQIRKAAILSFREWQHKRNWTRHAS